MSAHKSFPVSISVLKLKEEESLLNKPVVQSEYEFQLDCS